jgi:MYXO-CTERM domain-containing protein
MRFPVSGSTILLSAAAIAAAALLAPSAHAAALNVNNPSFESPAIGDTPPFAGPTVDNWVQLGEFGQTGQFYNTAQAGSPPVQNADGQRLAFVFANEAAPDALKPGLEQDLVTGVGSTTPLTFQVGQAYTLSTWLQGGGGGMALGVPINLELYYVNPALPAGSQRVPVATATVLNDHTGTIDALAEHTVTTPVVQANDAWAGKQIGVLVQAAGSPTVVESGYWDIDRVSVTSAVPEPSAALSLAGFAAAGLVRRRRRGVGRD